MAESQEQTMLRWLVDMAQRGASNSDERGRLAIYADEVGNALERRRAPVDPPERATRIQQWTDHEGALHEDLVPVDPPERVSEQDVFGVESDVPPHEHGPDRATLLTRMSGNIDMVRGFLDMTGGAPSMQALDDAHGLLVEAGEEITRLRQALRAPVRVHYNSDTDGGAHAVPHTPPSGEPAEEGRPERIARLIDHLDSLDCKTLVEDASVGWGDDGREIAMTFGDVGWLRSHLRALTPGAPTDSRGEEAAS